MGESTEIRWTDHTFNIVWGCTRVSEACQHCYAETLSKRYGYDVWGKSAQRRTMSDNYWRQPLRWNRKAEESGEPKLVFCSSMADVFEDHPTNEQERPRLWDLVARTPWLTWQLLTKRPENVPGMVPHDWWYVGWPPNVWVGTTVESQRWADVRLPHLVKVPAPVLFVSAEPLFSHLNLTDHLAYRGAPGVNWVITGGESGPKAQPSHPNWFRNVRDTCAAMGVPYLHKQWGEWAPAPWKVPKERASEGATHCIRSDTGHWLEKGNAWDLERADECHPPFAGMRRVGKKAAGWVLDGRTHDAIPPAHHPKPLLTTG